jgi:hypothetical protein
MKNHLIKIEVNGVIYVTYEKAFTLKGAIRKATKRLEKRGTQK